MVSLCACASTNKINSEPACELGNALNEHEVWREFCQNLDLIFKKLKQTLQRKLLTKLSVLYLMLPLKTGSIVWSTFTQETLPHHVNTSANFQPDIKTLFSGCLFNKGKKSYDQSSAIFLKYIRAETERKTQFP